MATEDSEVFPLPRIATFLTASLSMTTLHVAYSSLVAVWMKASQSSITMLIVWTREVSNSVFS